MCWIKNKSGPVPPGSGSRTPNGWCLWRESRRDFSSTDSDVSLHLSHDPNTLSHYNSISNAGIGALVGGAAGMWLLSYPSHNEHWRETGLLAGEAALNSLVPVEVFKYGLGRERPLQGMGGGRFFQGGTSFPSEHSAAAWAVAGVIGARVSRPSSQALRIWPGFTRQLLPDSGRVQHFPSDVFIGSIVGSLIAQQIYSRHHDPELGGSDWRSIGELFREGRSAPGKSRHRPMCPWIAGFIRRSIGLAAFGLVDSGFAGDRPWTRRECARLVSEAEEHRMPSLEDENRRSTGSDRRRWNANFVRKSRRQTVTRAGRSGWSRCIRGRSTSPGTPFRDGYHFRADSDQRFWAPLRRRMEFGKRFFGIRHVGPMGHLFSRRMAGPRRLCRRCHWRPGKQFSRSTTTRSCRRAQPSRQSSSSSCWTPTSGLMFSNWQVSFGRQSLWWGPGDGGPLIFSDNMRAN